MIAGLEKADEGNIYIGDNLANELEPKDRDVGVVFQSYALYLDKARAAAALVREKEEEIARLKAEGKSD